MNRNEAIERAARDFIDTNRSHERNRLIDALAMPKDCDLIFWNGPKYSFYTESLEMGEQIVKHLPNSDDFTATALSPKADAERVALLERIDKDLEEAMLDEESTELLRDIRAHLGGDA